ncbi:hypothetical protein A2U01_0113352, partial [Trifolium medium]|nr:hypothetical protein [Trifolium medium]
QTEKDGEMAAHRRHHDGEMAVEVNGTVTNIDRVMAVRCSMTDGEVIAVERDGRKRESCPVEEAEEW